jgi:hypothetical protein
MVGAAKLLRRRARRWRWPARAFQVGAMLLYLLGGAIGVLANLRFWTQ